MIRSMTGYCKTEFEMNGYHCHVEIRSVNHRYLDTKIHIAKQFLIFEEALKKRVKSKISRGKVDVHIQLVLDDDKKERLTIDQTVWNNIQEIKRMLEKDLREDIQVQLSDLLTIKDLLVYKQDDTVDMDLMEEIFTKAMDQALDEIIKMKEREGEILYDDFTNRLNSMNQSVDSLSQYLTESIENQKSRLKKNLENIGSLYDQDDPRIAQEIGVFIDRADITEEIERYRSHLIQLAELFESDEPVGRKLDFILQELNREANTICSKSAHVDITRIGVELKSEIEKVREQAQNIE